MFDLVHDIAGAYRRLVKANSYPGDILSIAEFSKDNTVRTPFYSHTLLMAYMLLDNEVTFAVVGHKEKEAAETIQHMTYATQTTMEEADFIFVLAGAKEKAIDRAIELAKPGDLIDPHQSASLIIEVDSVTKGADFLLSGPGIKAKKKIQLTVTESWTNLRGMKNIEYPMGIEMYFVDEDGDMMALPRTTQLEGWAV